MKGPVRIALIGDYNPEVKAHVAIPVALGLATAGLAGEVESVWIPTTALDQNANQQLSGFDAIWCVPNSPYASMTGVLDGIRFARESGRPFLGTCGGFQHAVIEYVRNVLGFSEADHAESNPASAMPVMSRLACSLAGARGRIQLQPGSRLSAVYGSDDTSENYQCNFGLNPRYESLLREGAMAIAARDENGEVRAVELAAHPFFVATLFQPEQSAFTGAAHPLICAFVSSAMSPLRSISCPGQPFSVKSD
jgi:CTP synthase (UTP-ammonia lyase)